MPVKSHDVSPFKNNELPSLWKTVNDLVTETGNT
eukprot:UN01867